MKHQLVLICILLFISHTVFGGTEANTGTIRGAVLAAGSTGDQYAVPRQKSNSPEGDNGLLSPHL
jgi:hypothetical protein